jgi:hypothetical protein
LRRANAPGAAVEVELADQRAGDSIEHMRRWLQPAQSTQPEARQPTPETGYVSLTGNAPDILRRPGISFDHRESSLLEHAFQAHAALRELSHRPECHRKKSDAQAAQLEV